MAGMNATIIRGKTTPASNRGSFAEHTRSAPEVSLGVQFGSYDNVAEKIAAMQAELEAATDALRTDEGWQRFLNTAAQFHNYSPSNQMLIQLQRPDATRCAGFKTWLKVNRAVRKGEKGIVILAPRLVNATDDAGEVILDVHGKPRKKVVGFTTATVFDISQTEGEPLPGRQEWSEEPPEGFQDDLVSAIEAQGYTVEFAEIEGSADGYTSASGKKVVISTRLNEGERAVTLAHELGHIMCGHMEKMGEYHTGHEGRRGDMEMEAESFAYVLARANGMEAHLRAASEYVASWQTRAVEDLRATAETVSRSVASALRGSKWRNLEAA